MDRPTLTIFAGPNGSGKTTLKTALENSGVNFPNYLNADDHAATLVGDEDARAREAQIWVRNMREKHMRDGANYSFETVMSHPSHLDHAALAKKKGYQFNLIFVGLERPELNVYRVRERVSDGGHAVLEEKIVSRFHRTMGQLPVALALCDRARLFDNSDAANPFTLLAKKESGRLDIIVENNSVPAWLENAITYLTDQRIITPI